MKTLKDATVLVVDDEPDLCSMLVFEFELNGCRVFSAEDGAAALEVLGREEVDVVVTDVKMPNASGMDLLRHIRSNHPYEPLVVFITAYDTVLSPIDAFDEGAEAILGKPFLLQDLTQRVARLLEPPATRWASAPGQAPDFALKLKLPDLETARAQKRLELGRGGFSVSLEDMEIGDGHVQAVEFNLAFESGPLLNIAGFGMVQWRTDPATGALPACGIEFQYLSDPTRAAVAQWVTSNPCRAFIPRLR